MGGHRELPRGCGRVRHPPGCPSGSVPSMPGMGPLALEYLEYLELAQDPLSATPEGMSNSPMREGR